METVLKDLSLDPLDRTMDDRIMSFLHKKLSSLADKENTDTLPILSTVAFCHSTPNNPGKGNSPTTTQKSWTALLKRDAPPDVSITKITVHPMKMITEEYERTKTRS